jgi:hypothetical protein
MMLYPYRPMTAPNGLNLKKSRSMSNSRWTKIMTYLRNHPHGMATKREMLENVFGLTIGQYPYGVSRGWASALWTLMVRHGDIVMIRKGNKIFYSIP